MRSTAQFAKDCKELQSLRKDFETTQEENQFLNFELVAAKEQIETLEKTIFVVRILLTKHTLARTHTHTYTYIKTLCAPGKLPRYRSKSISFVRGCFACVCVNLCSHV